MGMVLTIIIEYSNFNLVFYIYIVEEGKKELLNANLLVAESILPGHPGNKR